MSGSTALDKAHEPKDVDLATAARGVWLVKVSVKTSLSVSNKVVL